MRPEPAPFTADEYEGEQLHDAAASLDLFAGARRLLARVGAVAILGSAIFVFGYCEGRKTIQPAPGEEAALAKANELLTRQRDSLLKVVNWEHAQNAILQQKIAAAPKVDIVAPGKVRIPPKLPTLEPRVVDVPVELTEALVNARQLNAALLAELGAEHQLRLVESARADSAIKAAILARARADSKLERITKYTGVGIIAFFVGRGTR